MPGVLYFPVYFGAVVSPDAERRHQKGTRKYRNPNRKVRSWLTESARNRKIGTLRGFEKTSETLKLKNLEKLDSGDYDRARQLTWAYRTFSAIPRRIREGSHWNYDRPMSIYCVCCRNSPIPAFRRPSFSSSLLPPRCRTAPDAGPVQWGARGAGRSFRADGGGWCGPEFPRDVLIGIWESGLTTADTAATYAPIVVPARSQPNFSRGRSGDTECSREFPFSRPEFPNSSFSKSFILTFRWFCRNLEMSLFYDFGHLQATKCALLGRDSRISGSPL